ncbi:hypothetical protein FNU76_10935 [Chitinimonas arctica]|uniref:Uncharacterized protein n=1 Tax=Chitinimonas arctica TaxID=2594795 RepID=A0A516SFN0_9NEIS|nr:hypothetical protein [Chitinimonas arctica]QDQ26838.1 hypothetical protein FNU76_10935 [Chitinimonas arctica]
MHELKQVLFGRRQAMDKTSIHPYARVCGIPVGSSNPPAKFLEKGMVGAIAFGIGHGLIQLSKEFELSGAEIDVFCKNAMVIHELLHEAYRINQPTISISLPCGNKVTFSQVDGAVRISQGKHVEILKGVNFRDICERLQKDAKASPGYYAELANHITEAIHKMEDHGRAGVVWFGIEYGAKLLKEERAGECGSDINDFCENAQLIFHDLYVAACEGKTSVFVLLKSGKAVTFAREDGDVVIIGDDGSKIYLVGEDFQSICKKLSKDFLRLRDYEPDKPLDVYGIFITMVEVYLKKCDGRNRFLEKFMEMDCCFMGGLDACINGYASDLTRIEHKIDGEWLEFEKDERVSFNGCEKSDGRDHQGAYTKSQQIYDKTIGKCASNYQVRMLTALASQGAAGSVIKALKYVDEYFSTLQSQDKEWHTHQIITNHDAGNNEFTVTVEYKSQIQDDEIGLMGQVKKNRWSSGLTIKLCVVIGVASVKFVSSEVSSKSPPPVLVRRIRFGKEGEAPSGDRIDNEPVDEEEWALIEYIADERENIQGGGSKHKSQAAGPNVVAGEHGFAREDLPPVVPPDEPRWQRAGSTATPTNAPDRNGALPRIGKHRGKV